VYFQPFTEKPTALLSFSNVNEGRKKIKIMQRQKKNIMTSKAIIDMVLKKSVGVTETQVAHTIAQNATN
jgi:hypothetical protein